MDPVLHQQLLAHMGIAYAITDQNLDVVHVSTGLEALPSPDRSWLGRPLLDLVPELVGYRADLEQILAGQLPLLRLPWINRTGRDGEAIYVTIVEVPYRTAQGEIAGIVHLVQDVTEPGSLEQQLAQHRNELRLLRDELERQNLDLAAANAELRRLDDLKSRFVSVAAHELRAPFSAILGYLEMLLDQDLGPLSEQQRGALETMQQSAERLLAMTSNLLDVTRIEAERIDLILEPTDLADLVGGVVSQYGGQLAAREQELVFRAAPGLPAALCDRARGEQIVSNLLSNAIKYTLPGGKIRVDVTRAASEGFLEVSIADTGVGIAPEDQAQLFDRFFRASSAAEARANGAGLGLYIAHALTELHGGRLWFESVLGQGSAFHVTFAVAGSELLSPR
ncbi:MAG: HAMP domain-containing histidine kinase [Anaerolineae bacterium]|nr:HAMP domain-containing histidine kinase [Anaerolineae bacterium]